METSESIMAQSPDAELGTQRPRLELDAIKKHDRADPGSHNGLAGGQGLGLESTDLDEAALPQSQLHGHELGHLVGALVAHGDHLRAVRRGQDGSLRHRQHAAAHLEHELDAGEHAGLEAGRVFGHVALDLARARAAVDDRGDEVDLAVGAGLAGRRLGADRECGADLHLGGETLGHLEIDLEAAQVVEGGDDGGGGDVVAGRDGAGADDAIERRLDFGLGHADAEQRERGGG
jgi:hypothetical protein